MTKLFGLTFAALLFFSCEAHNQVKVNLQTHVTEFVSDSCFWSAGVGIVISDIETGEVLASNQQHLGLIPASVQKLITTASALEILGANYQFKTQVETDGVLFKNGTLNGNLIIRGFGDPSLGSKYFTNNNELQILEKIKSLKIKRISGQILTNTSFLKSCIPATWIWEDIGNYYGAVPNGLSFRDNMYTLFFKSGTSGSKTQILKTIPQYTGLQFDNHVVSSDINKDLAYIFGGNTSTKRRIEGSIPQNKSSFKVKGALSSPDICLKNELSNLLSKAGISVANKAIESGETQILFTQYSPLLKEIVKVTNLNSVNLFADHLLFEIGSKQSGTASWDAGIAAIKKFWEEKGISSKHISLYDGSGLSHFNNVSADVFNQVLRTMYKSDFSEEFMSSLPVAGESGTLKSFGTNSPIKGHWFAKTGSMKGVRTYCGYLINSKKKVYAVSILINNHSCSTSTLTSKLLTLLNKLYYS